MNAKVLYESKELKRKSIDVIYGTKENIDFFTDNLNTSYTSVPAKRVTLKTLKNIVVHGEVPQIRQVSSEQMTKFNEHIPVAAVLVQKWGYGYFHFLVEILPKVLRLNEINKSVPILIDYNTIFIKQVLEYVKITNQIIPYNNNVMFFPVKEALHITETDSGHPTQSDIEIIRKYININSTGKRQVNIIIYRKEQLRSISNFDEVFEALKMTFPDEEWIIFDSLSFSETVELFSRAKRIIGAHGAGLTNMLFAPKGTQIIELFPNDIVNLCYWHLSWTLNNPHYILANTSSGPPLYNITADIQELITIIKYKP